MSITAGFVKRLECHGMAEPAQGGRGEVSSQHSSSSTLLGQYHRWELTLPALSG